MIDTLKVAVVGSWRPGPVPSDWVSRESVVVESDERGTREVASRFLTHKTTGARVWGAASGPSWVEASLPRQVFPHNGVLIADDSALDAALQALQGRLARVVEAPEFRQVNRLDTVWQFSGDPTQWVGALGASRWKGTRSEPRIFFGESVEWVGDTQVLRVYDKLFEATGQRGGDVVRVEHQAKARKLKGAVPEALGLRRPETLRVAQCYQWYRGHVETLPAFKVVPPAPMSISAYLGLLKARDVTIDGVPAEEVYLRNRSRATQFRLRAKIAAALSHELVTVDFKSLLPEAFLPPVVNLAA